MKFKFSENLWNYSYIPFTSVPQCQFYHICFIIFSVCLRVYFFLKHLRVGCKPYIPFLVSCTSMLLKFILLYNHVQWSKSGNWQRYLVLAVFDILAIISMSFISKQKYPKFFSFWSPIHYYTYLIIKSF